MNNVWLNGIMGVVVGDALGCPVEFKTRNQIANRKQGKVKGMEGFGTFHLPSGSWTDDTSMTLATLDALNECRGINGNAIMEGFARWYNEGKYTPYGVAFDIGRTSRMAIGNYMHLKDSKCCGMNSEMDNGNGSLMRIMPAVLYAYHREGNGNVSAAIKMIDEISELTHAHDRSKIACGIYYMMAKSILRRKTYEPLIDCLQRGMNDAAEYYRNNDQLVYYKRMFDLKKLATTNEDDIKSSGYVVDSLEAAVWALITTSRYDECTLKCVNLGGDTDTIAAIAGGLAGLYYGVENIPSDWLEVIKKRDMIENMCVKANKIFEI